MKIEDKKVDGCRVKFAITAPAEETQGDYNKIADIYKRKASIRGFRPGKAPLAIIEKFYGKELNADVRASLVRRFLEEAITQEKLDVVARVNVSDVNFSTATGISFTAEVDVHPEFKLPKYQKLPVKIKEVTVEDEAIDKQIEGLRASMSPREDSTEPIAAADMVQIDFSTKCTGDRTLADVVPSATRYSEGKDYWTLISEESEFIPGMNAALTGKKVGDQFTFDAKFLKSFPFEALRGQKAKYDVTIKAVRRAKPLDDEKLVKNTGLKTMDELRDAIRKHMLDEANAAEDASIREQISTILAKKADFDLPQSIVGMIMERKLDQVIRQATQGQQDPKAYAQAHAKELQKAAVEAAERQVHLDYIFEAIAKEQKIEVSEAEVQKEIEAAAQYYAMRSGNKSLTAAKLRANLEQDGTIVLLRTDLLSAKVLNWLVEDAKASKAPKAEK